MKFYILGFGLILLGCSANENKGGEANTIKAPVYSKENLSFGCYQMIVDKDSANMHLKLQGGDSVTGTLQYNRFEKDDNSGYFAGKLDNNKLVGWYKFQSEGVVTVRQAIFKIIGDRLAEGYGDVSATGDTAFFTYPQTLNYEEAHPFQKVNCPDSSTTKL